MACLKQIQGEKTRAYSRQRRKCLKERKITILKEKALLLKEDPQEKRTLICCGAVSKDVLSNYDVPWLGVQSTCIDFNGRKITQH